MTKSQVSQCCYNIVRHYNFCKSECISYIAFSKVKPAGGVCLSPPALSLLCCPMMGEDTRQVERSYGINTPRNMDKQLTGSKCDRGARGVLGPPNKRRGKESLLCLRDWWSEHRTGIERYLLHHGIFLGLKCCGVHLKFCQCLMELLAFIFFFNWV